MRMNYRIYPIDYVNELLQSGKRKRAMAFMSYWHDMEMGDHHSIGFYAKAWDVSKSTAWDWVQEFKRENDLFDDHRTLKNQQHYSHVKKSAERNERSQPNETNADKALNNEVCTDDTERTERPKPNKDFNIDDNNTRAMFQNIFFIYKMNGVSTGRREEALEEYINHLHIPHKEMIRAIYLYSHDTNNQYKYNLKNFLANQEYLKYISTHMRVNVDGEWISGTYDDIREVFVSVSGKEYKLTIKRLAEKMADGELSFEIGEAA